MKYTLLQIVQNILNDMDGDEVNSIDDSFESTQVAEIVKTTYYAMISNKNWPHTRRSLQLESSGDDAYPTHMSVNDEVKELCFINYNAVKQGSTRRDYKKVAYLNPDDFLRVLNRRDSDSDKVDVIQDYTGVELLISNDTYPKYYTSFDDKNIVFDSYDSDVDSTLQKSKVQSFAYIIPAWEHDDEFIPDLPSEAFSALIAEAKSTASLALRQVANTKAEQESTRQRSWLSRKDWTVKGGVEYPNYGRKR